MKQYIFSALCLVSGAFCLSSCNDDKEARPYTPDYEIVPEYTNADTWKAYEAFNEHLLDQNKFIYKSSTADKAAVDRWNGAAAIWCQPTYWDMAMNAYKILRKNKNLNSFVMICLPAIKLIMRILILMIITRIPAGLFMMTLCGGQLHWHVPMSYSELRNI